MESVAYIVGKGGPAELEKSLADIQQSGLTTAILGMLHIGWSDPKFPNMKLGDLIYNDYPGWFPDKRGNILVSEGKFNPTNDPEIAKWPGQVAQLKQNSKVSKVLLSLGGAGPLDFTHIQNDLDFGKDPRFTRNITALKQAVPALDGIDFDCEESGIVDQTFVNLAALFQRLNLEVTFCPYWDSGTWLQRMQAIFQQTGVIVSSWNLQCYAGGGGNLDNLKPWIDALDTFFGPGKGASHLVPGLVVAGEGDVGSGDWQCPNQIRATIKGWNVPSLQGVFLWTYDWIGAVLNVCAAPNSPLNPTLRDYVRSING